MDLTLGHRGGVKEASGSFEIRSELKVAGYLRAYWIASRSCPTQRSEAGLRRQLNYVD